MSAHGCLTRSGLFSRLRSPLSLSIKEMSGAAQATLDVEFFTSPSSGIVDAQRHEEGRESPHWVFMGFPGVGKGTYASRLAKVLGVPHIAMGDLVRLELKSPTVSKHLDAAMRKGELLPDEVIFDILTRRLNSGMAAGERGFILDGFPRTISQAETLEDVADVDLVVNLKLPEEIVIAKCLGRRTCSTCGGNFNLAEIKVEGRAGQPGIFMPPLLPPLDCVDKMVIRSDDTDEIVRARLRVYREESTPVENYYRNKGKILDFSVAGGIPETWPHLLAALNLQDRVDPHNALAA